MYICSIFFGVAFILTAWLTGPSIGCSFVAFLTNVCRLFCEISLVLVRLRVIVHPDQSHFLGEHVLQYSPKSPVRSIFSILLPMLNL
jgi:hypothetical protein